MLAEAAKAAPAMPGEIPGFIAAMNAAGSWKAVPILVTATERRARRFSVHRAHARAHARVAGGSGTARWCIHQQPGAMVSTTDSDPDGALYALAREAVGAGRSRSSRPSISTPTSRSAWWRAPT